MEDRKTTDQIRVDGQCNAEIQQPRTQPDSKRLLEEWFVNRTILSTSRPGIFGGSWHTRVYV